MFDEWTSDLRRTRRAILAGAAVCGVVAMALPVAAQTTADPRPPSSAQAPPAGFSGLASPAPADQAFTLTFQNREITVLRATFMTRSPADRAGAAAQQLDQLIGAGQAPPVGTREFEGAVIIMVGTVPLFVIFPSDVDDLRGETLEGKVQQAVPRLKLAIDEAVEMRTPARLLRSGLEALGATVLLLALLWIGRRVHAAVAGWLAGRTERELERRRAGALVRLAHLPALLRQLMGVVELLTATVLLYAWATFVLQRFPYTRPWGESLLGQLLSTAAAMGLTILHSLPDLLIVLGIFILARAASRFVKSIFDAAERGTVTIPWLYPETAQPTKRIAITVLWLFAVIIAYPYLPGSDTDAFKGMSVFVGLIVSLGSTGLTNQIMSGFTLLYSRALRVGDFVKVGNIEGTVLQIGLLSTKIMTPVREEVTVPNAVVVSTTTTNFSRPQDTGGGFFTTTVTIGYDAPWRQIEGMLLKAAARTPGVRATPVPRVQQTGLADFYVQYMLMISPENPHDRLPLMNVLHANIQDEFNEHGVQIMSPHYLGDPTHAKVVPKDKWFTPPTRS